MVLVLQAMNTNDIAVSVIEIIEAGELRVKIERPQNAQALEEGINKAVSQKPNIPPFIESKQIVGQMVLAKLATDQGVWKYRRAVAQSVNSNNLTQIKCEFVDDGISESVPLAAILPCPDDIKKMDPHVRTLRLINLKPIAWQPSLNPTTGRIESNLIISENWAPAANYFVADLFPSGDSKKCRAEVMQTDQNGIWFGDLHVWKNERLVSLRSQLIGDQFAKEFVSDIVQLSKPVNGPRSGFGKTSTATSSSSHKGSNENANLQQNMLHSYLVLGSKPLPASLDNDTKKSFCNIVRQVHEFRSVAHQEFVWAGIEQARNVCVTINSDLLLTDENAISMVVPILVDAIGGQKKIRPTDSTILSAIFIVPSGPVGSKLHKQLSKLDLKVEFLHTASTTNASNCQVLIVTPTKLSQFIRNAPNGPNMEMLKFVGLIFVDDLTRTEDDRKVLHGFKQYIARFRQAIQASRLFGLTRTWCPSVKELFAEWFRPESGPLSYFLDLAEASIFCKTFHSFVDGKRDVLPRCLMETLHRLQQKQHRIAICCDDEYYEWILSILKQNSVTTLPLCPQLVGLKESLIAEFNHWTVSPEKQCLLVPDSLLRPEVGFKPHATIGATAIIHAVSLRSKEAFRARFMLMKAAWQNSDQTVTESVLLLESLPRDMCTYVNDLLERSDAGRSQLIDKWAEPSSNSQATNEQGKIAVTGVQQTQAEIVVNDIVEREMCTSLLESGKCDTKSTCKMRHVLKADLDDPQRLEHSPEHYVSLAHLKNGGLATFQILSVASGNRFTALMKAPVSSANALLRIDRHLRYCYESRNEMDGNEATPKLGQIFGAAFDSGATLRRVLVLKDLGISEANFFPKSAVLKQQLASNTANFHLHKFRCRLVDVGNVEKDISGDTLFVLNSAATSEPRLTVDVILCNVRPSDRAWHSFVKAMLEKEMIGREFQANVALVFGHYVFVRHLIHHESCSAIGNVSATKVDIRNLLVQPQKFSPSETAAAVSNPEHLRLLVEMCVEAKINIPPGILESLDSTSASSKSDCPLRQQPENQTQSNSLKLQESSLDIYAEAQQRELQKVRISAVTTPATFFVQRMDMLEKLEKLNFDIAEWIKQEGESVPSMSCEMLVSKSLCLARLPADQGLTWNRVLIRKANPGNRTVDVFAVDQGECENIPISDVRPISTHLVSAPAFAIECRLAHVKPRDDFGEQHFSEDSGDALWTLGIVKNFSRTFKVRVLEKTEHGYFCRTGCYVVELWPDDGAEKDELPLEPHTQLSAASQLIRLAVVLPDMDFIVLKLKSLRFSETTPDVVMQLFNQVLPQLLNAKQADEQRFQAWMEQHDSLLAEIARADFEPWSQIVDLLSTCLEIGDFTTTELALDLLVSLVFNAVQPDDANAERRVTVLHGLAKRLLPEVCYLVSLTMRTDSEEDRYLAEKAGELLAPLVKFACTCDGNSDATVRMFVNSGLIAALIHQATSIPLNYGCLQLLCALIESPAFMRWLRKMSSLKPSCAFLPMTSMIETHPWAQLAKLVQILITENNARCLGNLIHAVKLFLCDYPDYIKTVEESELGALLQQLPKQLESKFRNDAEWSDVASNLKQLGLIFVTVWDSEFDPETDSDRASDRRIRPSYRLPPSVASENLPPKAPAPSDNSSFGTVLWSQNHSFIHLLFDNSNVTKNNLLAQIVPPDDSVLRLTLMNSHRTIEVPLFGIAAPDSVSIRDCFGGAEVKFRKRVPGEWLTIEAPGKRMGLFRVNFDEVDYLWSDDDEDDEQDEENKEAIVTMRRKLLLSNGGGDNVVENGDDESEEEQAALDENVLIFERARQRLPEDYSGDDDEFVD